MIHQKRQKRKRKDEGKEKEENDVEFTIASNSELGLNVNNVADYNRIIMVSHIW